MKRLGFNLRIRSELLECAFNPRDWGILTGFCQFSNASAGFRSQFGIDALSSEIALTNPTALVKRRCSHFRSQVAGILGVYADEAEDLSFNYQVERARYQEGPRRMVKCIFLGYDAFAIGGSGFCTLELSQAREGKQRRVIGKLDLRPFQEFEVDDGLIVKIKRRKAKESQIQGVLESVVTFLSDYDHREIITIELFG